jgi:hypothetical protein
VTFPQPGFFANKVIFTKLTIFGNTKQVIQDYDTVFDNSIPFRKNDLVRIPSQSCAWLLKIQRLRIVISCEDKPEFWHAISSTLKTSPWFARRATERQLDPSSLVGVWGYPQQPEANVKWFSVASPGPAGNF